MIGRIHPLGLLLSLSLAAAAQDDGGPSAQGLDLGQTVHTIHDLVSPGVHGEHPWSEDIANLSGDDPREQNRAIARLIERGAVVIPDLTVLSKDHDPLLRSRVVQVVAGIGGAQAAPLLLALSQDEDWRVQENATLGLGRCQGPGVFERLCQQHVSPQADIRRNAALAMGALGDIRALDVLSHLEQETDDLVKRDESDTLLRVASQEAAIPEVGHLIATTSGVQRDTLLIACAQLCDPRLCPSLVAALAASSPLTTRFLAAQALATNGDSRAWQALCQTAADDPADSLRENASGAMRSLTGLPGSGQGWTVWWRDHAALVPRLQSRDILVAALHDESTPISRAQLMAFSVDELSPLLDGALGAGAPWWPARAWAAIRADEPERWTMALEARVLASNDTLTRLSLVLFIDQLGGRRCLEALQRIQKDHSERVARDNAASAQGKAAPDRGAEQVALTVALARHGAR
jgi:HEAT repeat protein